MTGSRESLPYAVALFLGLILWSITAWMGKRIEPWDAPGYWTAAYPLAALLSGALGYFFPKRPWRWAASLIFSQLIVMFAGGAGVSLLPLGLILLVFLTLPAVGAAWVGAKLKAWSAS